jgi:hypothetical protein
MIEKRDPCFQSVCHGHIIHPFHGVIDQHDLGVDLQSLVDRSGRRGLGKEIFDELAAMILRNKVTREQLAQIGVAPVKISLPILFGGSLADRNGGYQL